MGFCPKMHGALMLITLMATLTLGADVSKYSNNLATPLVQGGRLPSGGKIWALLVAGSSGYYNYRHQADVCHAYQILHHNGIPDENIIVMMYDDVARSPDNPTPNVILNHPKGPNVYKGVPIDYSGDFVNSTNFLAVLTGDEGTVKNVGSGRVIRSGPKDHVFVNFVDHGAPGFLCFPNEELHARLLEKTLKSMAEQRMFDKMVLYVEACESGSMFETILPDNMDVFVMTAADPRESSYACYYDDLRSTYLGDVFSVKWMEDSDTDDLTKESIHHMYELVRSETNTSHVEEYGDLDVGSLPVAYFLGSPQSEKRLSLVPPPSVTDAVPSRDVALEVLKKQLASTSDEKKKTKLRFAIHHLMKMRRYVDEVISDITMQVAQGHSKRSRHLLKAQHRLTSSNLDCYEDLVKHFSKTCFQISKCPYCVSKMPVLINMCSEKWTNKINVHEAMDSVCSKRKTGESYSHIA